MHIIFWILLTLLVIAACLILFLKRVPHGWVLLRTGLVLRFLPPLDKYPVVQLRHSIEDFIAKKIPQIKKALPVASVRDIDIPTRHGPIVGRVYQGEKEQPGYVLVLIHGGGWCIGSINTYEEVSRRLVRQTGLSLISLDYSLAPEHKFPIAHEECLDAVGWITTHTEDVIRKDVPLILVGDSAGGNLILSTLYESPPAVQKKIKKMIPVYPAADSRNKNYPSARDYAYGYYLTKKSMEQFTEGLLRDEGQADDLRLSPIEYDTYEGFPEIFIITAEFDPLRDQGEAYAAKLKKEGRTVHLKRYKGTIHAFFGLKDFGHRGIEAIIDIKRFIDEEPIPGTMFP